MRGRIKFEWGVKLQGTEAKEENVRLRGEEKRKGAESSTERNKMHESQNNM